MTGTLWLWRILGTISLAFTILLCIGFVDGVRTVLFPAGEPIPEAGQPEYPDLVKDPVTEGHFNILALGDSLTRGVGDDQGGYVERVRRQLAQSLNQPVHVWNFAVNGATTADLLAELGKDAVVAAVRQAHLILFTIGGNDLNEPIVRLLRERLGANWQQRSDLLPDVERSVPDWFKLPLDAIRSALPKALEQAEAIFQRLAELNPEATLLYLGLYHPYLDFDSGREGMLLLEEWNHEMTLIAARHPHAAVVPTADLFQFHLTDYLYYDHFHPNGAGHQRMAERVLQLLGQSGSAALTGDKS